MGVSEVVFLRSVDRHLFKEELSQKVKEAVKYFPELENETIYVGILDNKDYADGRADSVNRIIKFRIDVKPTYVTIFHELMHVAIRIMHERGEKVPLHSEEFCSISAMARMPPELIDEDSIPYIGTPKVPKHLIPRICGEALEYRKHHRDYIQKCKEWLGCSVRQWMMGNLNGIWVEAEEVPTDEKS